MLPHNYRLPAPRIPLVLRYGRRVVGDVFQLSAEKGEADVSRFAIIVSTKVDKRATGRNRMRRLLSESIRLRMNDIATSWDCVFVVKKQFGELSQAEAEDKAVEVLKKAGVL